MAKLKDGTTYRLNDMGYFLKRGKRELHILGRSVAQVERARELMAKHTFHKLFTRARPSPYARNVRYIKLR